MIDLKLLDRIKDELKEDLNRYDGDYNEWSEIVRDCPSNTLTKLYGEVNDEDGDELTTFVDKVIDELK